MEAARDASRRQALVEARDLFAAADGRGALGADDLHAWAWAAWLTGQPRLHGDLLQRAFSIWSEAGNSRRASVAAMDLARMHVGRLEHAMAAGWFAKAERLLDGGPDCVEQGALEFSRSLRAQQAADLEKALRHAERALDLGTRFSDRELIALALNRKGRVLILQGRVAEGRALLDEAMVAVVAGDVSPMATGVIYCATIDACAGLSDFGRASEWTEAARRWCARKSLGGFPGLCRVHRAEIVRLRGALTEALGEATRAAEELAEHEVFHASASAHYEVGEIRLRMGDLEGAAAAFKQAHAMGRDPEPGRSLLLLAQGKAAAACASIARTLSERKDRLGRTRLLPAAIEIAIAAGDLPAARAASEELEDSAQTFGSPALQGAARVGRGGLRLAEKDAALAISLLREGLQIWSPLDLPYEVSRARLVLARAYRAQGDDEAARAEIEAARETFARIGAVLDEERASSDLVRRAEAEAPARAARTFMFTDIVKSTNLVEAIGDVAWGDLIRWHDEALRSCFAEHHGEEIKHTGDGFHVAFETAADAIACAIGIQRRLAAHRRAHGFAPSVRIGLHATEASRQDGDWHGVGVHEAARIAALAEGGEIVVSVETTLGVALPAPLSDERSVSLRGISAPVRVARVDWK